MILEHDILQLPVLVRGSKMADTSQQALSEPHTNGVMDGLTEDEKSKMRPADIDAVSFMEYGDLTFPNNRNRRKFNIERLLIRVSSA